MSGKLKQKCLKVNGIAIIIRRKPIKNLYLRIEQETLQAVISAPLRMSAADIEQFVLSRENWLRQKLNFLAKRKLVFATQELSDQSLWLWGKTYKIRFVPGRAKTVLTENEVIFSEDPEKCSSEKRTKCIEKLYRQQLTQHIETMAAFWQQRLQLTASGWRIRKMKTRWGTCNTISRTITINYNLVRLPVQCLEYIIVHELAHLYEPSHSSRFKDFLTHNLPDWKQRESLLKHFTF